MTYLGKGASSEGDFQEACNIAGVVRAPIVFVIQNNGWAISTPSSRQTAATSLSSRVEGYGIVGALVDGNDLFAVYHAASEAVARARAGGGPTVIEARTFRMSFHNTTDNPRRYRDPAVEHLAAEQDPTRRVEHYLAGLGLFDNDLRSRWQQELAAEIDRAIQAVANFPPPALDDVFEHVYGTLPPRLEQQRQAMRKHIGD